MRQVQIRGHTMSRLLIFSLLIAAAAMLHPVVEQALAGCGSCN